MSNDIQKRSAEHLINLRAVYQKNPELIDEFVRALRFDCLDDGIECPGCALKNQDGCSMFCINGLEKLDGLLNLVREDLPPVQEPIIEVCITSSIGEDFDGTPFVDDWIVRGKTSEELVKNALDAVAGDMIENETAIDYAYSLASFKVSLKKAGED